ncbi:hypothetical protein SALB1_2954 [Salinisphaera sp. LB1]|nr:hypothetical protein SALB1_2954 [Salinisphaera sp. LB1]
MSTPLALPVRATGALERRMPPATTRRASKATRPTVGGYGLLALRFGAIPLHEPGHR